MSFGDAQKVYKKIIKANKLRAPALILRNDGRVNAGARFYLISINKGMLEFVKNEDELAIILGHELAHFNLGHKRSNHENEFTADRVGAIYAERAGYDRCRGVIVIKRFNSEAGDTHPSSRERYNRLRCVFISTTKPSSSHWVLILKEWTWINRVLRTA